MKAAEKKEPRPAKKAAGPKRQPAKKVHRSKKEAVMTKEPIEKTEDPNAKDKKSDAKHEVKAGTMEDLEKVRTGGKGVAKILIELHADGDFFCEVLGYEKEMARGQSRESIGEAIGKCLESLESGVSLGFPEQKAPGAKEEPKAAAHSNIHTTRDMR